ncbi:hypothetical protein QC761_400360 [Podospora bellae-mahoneyi]|uniref:Zn(2)-C6 fungal-type domain-containing protein n=1 Tax=Podospora bellae-mahoneyi TaxID=2093777 RepID=A0ABR0FFK6_9PEZI|nr:hypothetical protein QC761_400360 [Podospora bellae-mahoneyi]
MEALCEDMHVFEIVSDREEWSDAEWNGRVPRGSWKRCSDCRTKTNVCEQCKFWLENYGCPRPDTTTNNVSSPKATETETWGSPSTRPYISSTQQVRYQIPNRRNSVLSDHGFGSWSLESEAALATSWTSVSKSPSSFTTEEEHRAGFDIHREFEQDHSLDQSYINVAPFTPRLPLYGSAEYTNEVVSHTALSRVVLYSQETEILQTHGSMRVYPEEHRDLYHCSHLPNTTVFGSSTSHSSVYTRTTTITSRTRLRKQAPKHKPNLPSPFDSGYIHVIFSCAHALSTSHVRGLWAPRPFQTDKLDSSWRWKSYKRVILRYYGLPGLVEVQGQGWGGSVKGGVVGLSIVFVEWPKVLWNWVTSWINDEVEVLCGRQRIGNEEGDVE